MNRDKDIRKLVEFIYELIQDKVYIDVTGDNNAGEGSNFGKEGIIYLCIEKVSKFLKDVEHKLEQKYCDHEHLCCPEGIKTLKCAYCGKSMYHDPKKHEIPNNQTSK